MLLCHLKYLSVHAPDFSDCGANAGFGCNHGEGVLLGAAHVLLGTGEAVGQRCCSCDLLLLSDSAAVGLETAAGLDLSAAAVVTVVDSAGAGSFLLRHLLLHPEAAAVSWLRVVAFPLGHWAEVQLTGHGGIDQTFYRKERRVCVGRSSCVGKAFWCARSLLR